jgi:excisionase family DNA binding protein
MRILTTGQAAEALQTSKDTVRRLIKAGELRGSDCGRRASFAFTKPTFGPKRNDAAYSCGWTRTPHNRK